MERVNISRIKDEKIAPITEEEKGMSMFQFMEPGSGELLQLNVMLYIGAMVVGWLKCVFSVQEASG